MTETIAFDARPYVKHLTENGFAQQQAETVSLIVGKGCQLPQLLRPATAFSLA